MEQAAGGIRGDGPSEDGTAETTEREKEKAKEENGLAMHGMYMGWPNTSQRRTHRGQGKR